MHIPCSELYKKVDRMYLPHSTLGEISYLVEKAKGKKAVAEFLFYLPQSRYEVMALTDEDIQRVGQMLAQYADTRLDFVDASVMALAERLKLHQILTLDRRDFSLIRPQHVPYFELLPSQQP